MDVSFGDAAKQKMDVYLPEGKNEQTPVVVLLHGGDLWLAIKQRFLHVRNRKLVVSETAAFFNAHL